MKKIVLITTGQPSTNPRLVKEADALYDAGYDVTVLYSFWDDWALKSDEVLLRDKKWKYQLIGGTPYSSKWLYRFTKIRNKLAKQFYNIYALPKVLPYIYCRSYVELLRVAKQLHADLYIAHNLGALPIAAKVASIHNTKYAFDAEDYHRGEQAKDTKEYRAKTILEDSFIPGNVYLSTASPLMGSLYCKHYPNNNVIVINNVFPSRNKYNKEQDDQKMKLFWFSQTIGKNRGIEDVIHAMGNIGKQNIILTLLGKSSEQNRRYFKKIASDIGLRANQLVFLDAIPPEEIFLIGDKQDIGLALEVPHCENRDICLTNKIFTYLLSGLAIIASETSAQKQFMEVYPKIGQTFPVGNITALEGILIFLSENIDVLKTYKKNALELGKNELNWEQESEKLLSAVNNVFAQE